MNGALRHTEPLGKIADTEIFILGAECLEQVNCRRNRREPGGIPSRVPVGFLPARRCCTFNLGHGDPFVPLKRTLFQIENLTEDCQSRRWRSYRSAAALA